MEEWYQGAVLRVLRTDARAPEGWSSRFEDVPAEARTVVPRRWLARLLSGQGKEKEQEKGVEEKIEKLLDRAPTLSIEFLEYVLDATSSTTTPTTTTTNSFRDRIHARIVARPEATFVHWITFAGELVKRGDTIQSNEIVRRGMGTLKGGERARFEKGWTEFVDLLERS